MSPQRRRGKKVLKTLLPIVLVVLLALASVAGYIVYAVTHPQPRPYLVTPEKFTQLSGPGLKATDETWSNRDGTPARGWLLRGEEGAPAVVLLHRYGADRSWLLNLGVKLNETTRYTVLWPDLRGHGMNPRVPWTSLGALEEEDVGAAIDYLRTLKTAQGRPLVGTSVGIYGVEMGAYLALQAASRNPSVRALVLDSVPASPDELLRAAVRERFGLDYSLPQLLARWGMRLYFLGRYHDSTACAAAQSLGGRRVLLLSGEDAGYLRDSTIALARCLPGPNVELKTDLPLTGLTLPISTGQQGEAYDRRVIDFFDKALHANP